MRLTLWTGNRASELRYALRMIRKTPGATAVAVLSLALGIGANTAIFSLVDALLLKLLPVRSPQELYLVSADPSRSRTTWNYPDYVAFRDRNSSFTGLAAFSSGVQPLGLQIGGLGSGQTTELAYALIVSGNYFDVLGVEPALGRLLNPEDDRKPGASPYTVLSYEFWQRRCNRDPGVLGLTLRLNGYPFTVVGVARRGFRGTDVTASPNVFIPLLMRGSVTGEPFARWNNRHYWWMQAIGRLKSGATVRQAESELYVVYRDQEETERRTSQDKRQVNPAQPVLLMPASRGWSRVRNQLQQPLFVLWVAVGLVLLIACANVANLMLARGAARQREIAVRLAVGATRWRLTGQLLVESILIALLGGAAGLVFAFFGVRVLLGFVPPSGWTQVTVNVSPDVRLLAFALAVSLLTGILFGIIPALRSARSDLVPALKDDVAGASGPSRTMLRNALMVLQIALSLLLLLGAGLLLRSLENLRAVDPGFRRDHTVLANVDPSRNGYKGQRLRDFYERLRASVALLPGVQSVSLAEITPLGGRRWHGDFTVESYQWKPGDQKYIDMNAVGPRYFETVGIPILLGRDFSDDDNPPFSPDPPESLAAALRAAELPGRRVAIISEGMAKRFFSGRNPIGLHVCFHDEYDPGRAYEIVGVVKDAHYFGLREAAPPMVYLSAWRPNVSSRILCIRTSRDAAGTVQMVRRQVTALDPAIPVLSSQTTQQQIDNDILVERLIATLSSYFGVVALLLAGVGLYGVISHSVARRTREIGIRMALGAQRSQVLWLVICHAGLLVTVGAAIGIFAAVSATRLVRAFLYGISEQDPLTIAIGTAVLAAAAALATFIPARRATKVDPLVALRYE